MNKLATALMTACLVCAGSAVYAQDAMSKDAMSKDAMSKDAVSKDEMKK
ncbi:MAG: pentapeptide MXKDX repeat protein [Betaproteobacteria bacterium]|nr:MAG: pentapeptide MXKDX repeat protein [Betaproteobacteria bacterium]